MFFTNKPKKAKVIWLDTSVDLEVVDWNTEPIQLKEIFKVKKDE
jgi:hypothetical protein